MGGNLGSKTSGRNFRHPVTSAEVAINLAHATAQGRAAFVEIDEPHTPSGLLKAKLRRQDGDGEWERRCRRCGEFMPEVVDFFSVNRNSTELAWVCRECRVGHERQTRRLDSDAARVKNAARRARLLAAPGFHTKDHLVALWDKQKGKCYWCGCQLARAGRPFSPLGKYHVDHVVPLSRGGSNGPENIVLACSGCNLRKSNKDPGVFKKASLR